MNFYIDFEATQFSNHIISVGCVTEKGDLLFTTEAPMGNAAICDLDECSCGQRVITMKPFVRHTMLPKLYMYFIMH